MEDIKLLLKQYNDDELKKIKEMVSSEQLNRKQTELKKLCENLKKAFSEIREKDVCIYLTCPDFDEYVGVDNIYIDDYDIHIDFSCLY